MNIYTKMSVTVTCQVVVYEEEGSDYRHHSVRPAITLVP